MQNDVRAMRERDDALLQGGDGGIAGGDETPGPIFIVGMPRTGTTLVERILGSHADVASVGEAVDFPEEMAASARDRPTPALGSTDTDLAARLAALMDFGDLGRNYLAAVRQLAGPQPLHVDKLPFNFRYCGLIHKALPKASIVHLTRDPMDTCYAVFKTLFINAYHFSYQLDELAEYYVAYRRMMDHWHAVMPGRHSRRELRGAGVGSGDAVPAVARALRAALAGRGARLPPLDESVHDGEHGAGPAAFLPLLGAEVAQLRARAAAGACGGWPTAGLVDADGNPLR